MVFATDTAYMLKDCGISASCGGVATYGILDSADELVTSGDQSAGVAGKLYRFLFKSTAWPTVAVGSTITISGTSYTVRERLAQDDGELTALLLAK